MPSLYKRGIQQHLSLIRIEPKDDRVMIKLLNQQNVGLDAVLSSTLRRMEDNERGPLVIKYGDNEI